MATQDAASPWVIDTRELVRRAGAMKETSRAVTAPDLIGTDVIAIRPGDPVDLDLRMESVMEGVLATGSVRATATGVCVRCLDEVEIPVDVHFQELFAYPDRAAHHQEVAADEDEQDDVYELEDDLMDLEELVRDAVVTALPFQPVCRDDCPGLCSECGARLADDPEHHHDVIDPRWSALADLAQPGTDDEKKRN
ncbi:YceD family protein [Ornithinimicrobium cavernae]|uniref:YceD family protein n=1 Tax=Ornithinimicrobium cavernae TaxID=2666047 RepID=UPI000D69B600|nr:YceD family protein [Ornithinimicrobium cavernae]